MRFRISTYPDIWSVPFRCLRQSLSVLGIVPEICSSTSCALPLLSKSAYVEIMIRCSWLSMSPFSLCDYLSRIWRLHSHGRIGMYAKLHYPMVILEMMCVTFFLKDSLEVLSLLDMHGIGSCDLDLSLLVKYIPSLPMSIQTGRFNFPLRRLILPWTST